MMRIYFLTKLTGKVLCMLLFLDFFKIVYWPDINLVMWGVIAIFMDLLTGIVKAHVKGDFVTSKGLRKTVIKLVQYVGLVGICFILTNIISSNTMSFRETTNFFGDKMYENMKLTLRYLNNLVLLIIVYTEFISILENLLDIDHPPGNFSKYALRPMHRIFTLYIIHNPFKKLADIKEEEQKTQDREEKETILKP